jgi:hypothetical protein
MRSSDLSWDWSSCTQALNLVENGKLRKQEREEEDGRGQLGARIWEMEGCLSSLLRIENLEEKRRKMLWKKGDICGLWMMMFAQFGILDTPNYTSYGMPSL